MRKKMIATIGIIALIFTVGGCSSKKMCIKSGCKNEAAPNSSYCYLHKPYTGGSYSSPKSSTSTSTSKYNSGTSSSSGASKTKSYTGNTSKKSYSSSSTAKSYNVEDWDIEDFYYDNMDEFDDIDDAWEYLEDNPEDY